MLVLWGLDGGCKSKKETEHILYSWMRVSVCVGKPSPWCGRRRVRCLSLRRKPEPNLFVSRSWNRRDFSRFSAGKVQQRSDFTQLVFNVVEWLVRRFGSVSQSRVGEEKLLFLNRLALIPCDFPQLLSHWAGLIVFSWARYLPELTSFTSALTCTRHVLKTGSTLNTKRRNVSFVQLFMSHNVKLHLN